MCATMDPMKASDETDTSKTTTGSTTPNSETASASSRSLLNEDQQLDSPPYQYDDIVLGQLARQLEYYFSQANLDKDTYVETLRQLNDGYVPVSILQRFSKVQTFAPVDTVDAIIKAASEYSEQLQVVPVDTKTGKRVEDEVPGTTILAVGPISGKPLQQLSGPHPAVVPTSPRSDVQNTIIIREVDSRVTEADVMALFNELDSCPPIQSLYLDFANCWFVTLDTESRDDMLYVMMQLRSQYLGDEPVKARLKSLVRTVDPAMPAAPVLPNNVSSSYSQLLLQGTPSDSGSNKGNNKKKQNKKNKGNKNHNNGNNNNNNRGSSNNEGSSGGQQHTGGKSNRASNNQRSNSGAAADSENSSHPKKSERQRQPQPDFSAESFPALSDQARKVEVVVDGMDAAEKPINSDSSSTATTLSSSSSSVTKQQQSQNKQPFGGYAAALLKSSKPGYVAAAAPAKKNEASAANIKKSNEVSQNASSKEGKQSQADNTITKEKGPETKATSVAAPAWGGGGRRSFADILRKEEATA